MSESTITTSKTRIDTIDVLRGFALTGILYAHMVIWYTGASLPPEVYSKFDSIADGIAMGIFGALVYGKFFSVFSFLFGLSFFLHFKKHENKTGYLKSYVWRLILLLLIGILHHIIWRGDILAIYAVLGILLIFFRKLPTKILLVLSLLFIINLPTNLYDAFKPEQLNATVSFPMEKEAARYYELVQNASFVSVLEENWNSWPAKIEYQIKSGRLLMTFGYFLLGFYAGRTGLFTSINRKISKFIWWNKLMESGILILLTIALILYLNNYVTLPDIKIAPQFKWLATILFDMYNACVTIFYITGITILFRMKWYQTILKPLAAMGRMALTIYLLQTVFGLLLFYQFGLGLFDNTTPAVNVLLGIIIFYSLLKFSQWWLKYFRQGPVEWLWKGLTYFKFPSNKRNDFKDERSPVFFEKE